MKGIFTHSPASIIFFLSFLLLFSSNVFLMILYELKTTAFFVDQSRNPTHTHTLTLSLYIEIYISCLIYCSVLYIFFPSLDSSIFQLLNTDLANTILFISIYRTLSCCCWLLLFFIYSDNIQP